MRLSPQPIVVAVSGVIVAVACVRGPSTGGSAVVDPGARALSANDVDAIARAAVVVHSCGVERIDRIMSEMVMRVDNQRYDMARRASRCLATDARGCASIERCMGWTMEPAHECAKSCDGDDAVFCADRTRVRMRCGSVGMVCLAGECVEPGEHAACSEGSFAARCDGGAPVNCVAAHVRAGPRCDAFGLVCGVSPVAKGEVLCHGAGPACAWKTSTTLGFSLDEGLRCEGANLVACVNAAEHVVPCDRFGPGYACRAREQDGGTVARCEPPIGACGPSQHVEARCEGSELVFCGAGAWHRVDCKSLGFSTCDNHACS